MADKRITVWIQHFKDRKTPVLQWHDPDTGKRKSQSAGTADEKEAEQARADKEYELNHNLHKDRSRMTWQRFRELFEEEFVASRRLNTRENYTCTLDSFEQYCHPTQLQNINERTISRFLAALCREPKRRGKGTLTASSVKVRLQFLRTALRWAGEQKLIAEVPRFPSVKVPKKKPKPVPEEVFERLYAFAPNDEIRAFLLCGWLAGLRLEEAYGLEWQENGDAPWLDFDRKRIVLPAERVKGVEDQIVPLDDDLAAALQKLPRTGGRVFAFLSPRYGQPMTSNTVSQRIIALAEEAGVRLSFRSLRRGFACAYAAEVPAQVLQSLLRHRNIQTTMAYYSNTQEAAAEAVRKRNAIRNNKDLSRGSNDVNPDPANRSENTPS
jgi:integrase